MHFTTTDLHDGARLALPRRDHEKAGRFGWGMAAAGAAGVALAVWLAGPAARWLLGPTGAGGAGAALTMGAIARVVGAIVVVRAALALVKFGMLIARGWSEVEISGGRIKAIERGALRPWIRSGPLDMLRSIEVTDALGKGTGEGLAARPATGNTPERSALVARFAGGHAPLTLAPGYPREVLLALAHEINDRLTSAAPTPLIDGDAPAIAISVAQPGPCERPPLDDAPPELPRPDNTDIELSRSDDGAMTIVIPAAGLTKGGKGLFPLATLWLLITGGATIAAVVNRPADLTWVGWIAIGLFDAGGVACLLWAIAAGTRATIIDVAHDALLVSRQSAFGGRSWSRERGQIASIRVGPSGVEINERPVIELQIHWLAPADQAEAPAAIRKFGLLAERSEPELLWLATELRAALGVGAGRVSKLEEFRTRIAEEKTARARRARVWVGSHRHEDRAA